MAGLLALIFIAALVGLIKPFIPNLTRKHFGMAAAVSFVGLMIAVPKPDPANAEAETATKDDAPNAVATTTESAATTPTTSEPASKWSYSEDNDQMRGTKSRYASVQSNNEVDLKFPYGETPGTITVRKNTDGLNVYFSVNKGQILCHNFTESFVSVKFDGGPVQKMRCTGTSDGSSETAFFSNESRVLAGLKKAKRTMIEAEFFQQGRQQFVFDTAGLKWS